MMCSIASNVNPRAKRNIQPSCHSRTKNLADKVRQADVLIAAIGIAEFVQVRRCPTHPSFKNTHS